MCCTVWCLRKNLLFAFPVFVSQPPKPADVATICFTSGTTGTDNYYQEPRTYCSALYISLSASLLVCLTVCRSVSVSLSLFLISTYSLSLLSALIAAAFAFIRGCNETDGVCSSVRNPIRFLRTVRRPLSLCHFKVGFVYSVQSKISLLESNLGLCQHSNRSVSETTLAM